MLIFIYLYICFYFNKCLIEVSFQGILAVSSIGIFSNVSMPGFISEWEPFKKRSVSVITILYYFMAFELLSFTAK